MTFDFSDTGNNCQHVPADLCDDRNPCTNDTLVINADAPECVYELLDGAPCEGGVCSLGGCVPQ